MTRPAGGRLVGNLPATVITPPDVRELPDEYSACAMLSLEELARLVVARDADALGLLEWLRREEVQRLRFLRWLCASERLRP
ncbi:MAG: hypothetical protein DCC58_15520 [Chloroflexi bacterium]|nr:MAG: hypothetical protein DCC58_15520 [Chloroflexota bacterium]